MKNLLCFWPLVASGFLIVSCAQNDSSSSLNALSGERKDSVSAYGPVQMVRTVKQARDGDVLIASYSGVWRYNGKQFTNITSPIPAPSFWDVLEDRNGNLWFGTKDSGVYRFDGRSFQHFTTRQGLPANSVLHLYEDKAGYIWMAAGTGVSRYDGKTIRNFTAKDGFPGHGVNTFMQDKTGKIWMGTREDMYVYDPSVPEELAKSFSVFRNQEGKSFYNVWAILEDQVGNVWFGGSILSGKEGSTRYLDGGLWRYNGHEVSKVSQRSVSAMVQDRSGNLWTTGLVHPPGGGEWVLSRYDHATLYAKVPVVSDVVTNQKMLCRIMEAKDGSIWFGSGKGVYRWDPRPSLSSAAAGKQETERQKRLTDFRPAHEHMYQIDVRESRITWKGSMKHSPQDKHVGSVSISKGELWINRGQLVGGDVEINMHSIDYEDKADENTPVQHLKSADYFDVRKFPFASLAIAWVDSMDPKTVQITAYLTVKNATRLLSFPASIQVKNGVLQATANLTIDRTHWGINHQSGKFFKMVADQTVSDEIEFSIHIVAKK